MIINPVKWFGKREIDHIPPHFIKCSTPITSSEMQVWVLTKLSGRHTTSIGSTEMGAFVSTNDAFIYFEDPSEAMLYELRWAGGK